MNASLRFISVLVIIAYIGTQESFGAASCGSNEAFKHNGFYYQFFDCPQTWSKAESMCKDKMVVNGRNVFNGHLASILDEEEKDWMKYQLEARYGSKVGIWIGAKRKPHPQNSCPNSFTWTDGNPFSYKNFLKGQPNCRWPGEDCLQIIDNDHWNDAECQNYMRFVCKLKLLNFDVAPPGES